LVLVAKRIAGTMERVEMRGYRRLIFGVAVVTTFCVWSRATLARQAQLPDSTLRQSDVDSLDLPGPAATVSGSELLAYEAALPRFRVFHAAWLKRHHQPPSEVQLKDFDVSFGGNPPSKEGRSATISVRFIRHSGVTVTSAGKLVIPDWLGVTYLVDASNDKIIKEKEDSDVYAN